MTWEEAAPAKLNLALHVRRRRADGYHDLETIFVFTDFGDTLTAAAADALSLTIAGEFGATIAGDDNLVLRAARALQRAAGVIQGAALHLDKHIPVAAGLGGGSADAAAALRLLNRMWGLDWPLDRLAAIGATLGADVPACVVGGVLRGEGRGEALTPLVMPGLAGPGLAGTPVLLVNPRVAVPTGPVFAGWDGTDRGALAPDAALGALRNDLTPSALALAPVIGDVLDALQQTAATFVRMSGSGATCFALYGDRADCLAAAAAVRASFPAWWSCASAIA